MKKETNSLKRLLKTEPNPSMHLCRDLFHAKLINLVGVEDVDSNTGKNKMSK